MAHEASASAERRREARQGSQTFRRRRQVALDAAFERNKLVARRGNRLVLVRRRRLGHKQVLAHAAAPERKRQRLECQPLRAHMRRVVQRRKALQKHPHRHFERARGRRLACVGGAAHHAPAETAVVAADEKGEAHVAERAVQRAGVGLPVGQVGQVRQVLVWWRFLVCERVDEFDEAALEGGLFERAGFGGRAAAREKVARDVAHKRLRRGARPPLEARLAAPRPHAARVVDGPREGLSWARALPAPPAPVGRAINAPVWAEPHAPPQVLVAEKVAAPPAVDDAALDTERARTLGAARALVGRLPVRAAQTVVGGVAFACAVQVGPEPERRAVLVQVHLHGAFRRRFGRGVCRVDVAVEL